MDDEIWVGLVFLSPLILIAAVLSIITIIVGVLMVLLVIGEIIMWTLEVFAKCYIQQVDSVEGHYYI